VHAGRGERHAVLVVLDFLGDTDPHEGLPSNTLPRVVAGPRPRV
jgi:hypothetical protein